MRFRVRAEQIQTTATRVCGGIGVFGRSGIGALGHWGIGALGHWGIGVLGATTHYTTPTAEQDFYAFMGLPAFLVTDHERVYRLSFWAKATGNPKPRPHITFQDEDNNYEYIYGDFVQLSAFWHQYHIDLVVPFKLRGHNVITNFMVGGFEGVYYLDDIQVVNAGFVAPPPASPMPPPSPPPNVLLQLDLENYDKGSITFQAWPEGEMQVIVQSPSAAHTGRNGLYVKVT